MSVQALARLMVPPTTPAETGSADQWSSVQETIGIALPAEYKEYIGAYGTGQIGSFL